MKHTLSERYASVRQINNEMRQMAQKGEWTQFIELAGIYIVSLQELLSETSEDIDEVDSNIVSILEHLVKNETEITLSMKTRLDDLQGNIAKLNQGKKCNQAYVTSFTTPF
jgi:flagellar protein FliT